MVSYATKHLSGEIDLLYSPDHGPFSKNILVRFSADIATSCLNANIDFGSYNSRTKLNHKWIIDCIAKTFDLKCDAKLQR